VLGGVGQAGWVLIEAFEVAAGGTGGVGIAGDPGFGVGPRC
jgi:hypothetical protein